MATTRKTPGTLHCQGRQHEVGAAVTELRTDLRTGGRDLFGDVETLVRNARRDTAKLGKALRADLGHLAKATTSLPAPPATPARQRSAPKPRRPAGSHPKKTAA